MSSFGGSERSGCLLQIYTQAKRGLSFYTRGLFSGASQTVDLSGAAVPDVELVTVSTVNAMGSGGGWQALLKFTPDFDPLASIPLGSWAYVSMVRNGTPHLVMAGRVTHRGIQEVSSGGVTTRTCNIVGGSFDLVWKKTKWWFYLFAGRPNASDPLVEDATLALIKGRKIPYLLADPATNVKSILYDFTAIMATLDRAPFAFPATMPGVGTNALNTVIFDDSNYFDNKILPITQPVASQSYPNCDVWSLAQTYQNGLFTECWTDILPVGGFAAYASDADQTNGLVPSGAQMTITFRDKPFPLVSNGLGPHRGQRSPYFSLPTHILQRSDIVALSIVGAEEEIFNAFSFSNLMTQESTRGFLQTQLVSQDKASQALHGLQHLESPTMYFSPNTQVQADYNRFRLRDWYCLGEELVSGSIQLGHGAPQIRVGSRVVVNDPVPALRWTFYVESVRNVWTAAGLSTTLDVTRGFRGTDAQYLARLESQALNYDDYY